MKRVSIRDISLKPQWLILTLVMLIFGGHIYWPSQSVIPATTPTAVQAAVVHPGVDCTAVKCIALTFDDGPDPSITPQILDILKNHDAHATFFVLGRRVVGNEALVRRMYAEGHEIGNHSWSHPYLTRVPLDRVRDEMLATQTVVSRAGVPPPDVFRPPYGDVNAAVASQIPLAIVRWNIDPEDWNIKRRDHLLEHMATFARPGGIVVLHDTEVTTAQQLDALIVQLQSQGYTLVTVSEDLGISSGQQGIFFSRSF